MLHGYFSRRLISVPPYLHLPKFFHPSISSRELPNICIHNQTHIKSASTSDYDLDHLLRQCTTIRQCQELHSQIFLTVPNRSAFLAARLVSTYARLGFLDVAQKVFETTRVECFSNLLLWNSILRANVAYGEYEEVIRLYHRLRNLGVGADGFTFPLVIRACALIGDSRLCKNVHCHVFQMGFQFNVHVVNELLSMYGKLGEMDIALRLFDRMLVRNHISWNTMVSGFAHTCDCDGAFEMFCKMELEGLEPNLVTWTSLLSSHARCGRHEETLHLYRMMRKEGNGTTAEALAVVISVFADLGAVDKVGTIHGYVIRGGFGNYLCVKNALICLYGKHGAVRDAENLFSEIESKSSVSWNTLISSYAESGLCDEAFAIFSQMENSADYQLVRPNIISWSSLIGGFASKGRGEESLELFRRMQLANVLASSVTLNSVLSVCAELSALGLGREIHGHVTKALMRRNMLVGNGLINMYAKCGSLNKAWLVFENCKDRDLVSWNLIIAGCGVHGLGNDALKSFEQMVKDGYTPDRITFVALLSACSHAGLVAEGRKLFNQTMKQFRIQPQVEHYACIVDLLGRAGFLQEASDVVRSMPMEPNAYVWGALLNSCRIYKNTVLAEDLASAIFSVDSETTGSYMLLSSLYAATGKWKDSARVRISAKAKGLKKIPGQSWIEVKKKVHTFSAGNTPETGKEEVHKVLRDLGVLMKIESYLPEKNLSPRDLGEEIYAC